MRGDVKAAGDVRPKPGVQALNSTSIRARFTFSACASSPKRDNRAP